MVDKEIKKRILQKLQDEMSDDSPKLMEISIQKVKPMKVAENDDLVEEGKKVIEGEKEKDKEKPGRQSVEDSDMDMFKDLLRKKGRKVSG